VARALKARDPAHTVVVMSAAHRADEAAEALQADGYLVKPFSLEAALDLVTRFVGDSS
jgi:DNA-binding NtrC family response regulator